MEGRRRRVGGDEEMVILLLRRKNSVLKVVVVTDRMSLMVDSALVLETLTKNAFPMSVSCNHDYPLIYGRRRTCSVGNELSH